MLILQTKGCTSLCKVVKPAVYSSHIYKRYLICPPRSADGGPTNFRIKYYFPRDMISLLRILWLRAAASFPQILGNREMFLGLKLAGYYFPRHSLRPDVGSAQFDGSNNRLENVSRGSIFRTFSWRFLLKYFGTNCFVFHLSCW